MIFFEILLIVILAISLWLNYTLFKKIMLINDSYDDILSSIEIFRQHIKQLNNYEIYMGEPTIEKLIQHSTEVADDIDDFLSGFSNEEKESA